VGTVAVVVISHRFPDQVQRLLHVLSHGTDTFVALHHDPSGEPLRGPLPSNAAQVPSPVRVQWGRWSVVDAVLQSMSFVRDTVPDFTWVLVVSGLDYPIHGMQAIERDLENSSVDAYLRYFPIDDPKDDVHPWQATCRRRYLKRRRLPLSGRTVPLPGERSNPFHGETRLFVGDLWVNLSALAVNKVLDSPLRPPMERYFRWASVPDEAFTPTVLLNGPGSVRATADSRRFIRWPATPSRHPLPITPDDLPALQTSDAFFARKIDPVRAGDVCERLDALAREAEAPRSRG